jgi:subtilisin-like proprotein convertase family protein
MKTKLILLAGLATGLALQLCPSALANTITVSGSASVGVIIPDNNLSGVASTIILNSAGAQNMTTIESVTVTLDIVGAPTAYNGDFYAYLANSSGLVVLFNNIDTPPAYGSPGNGINVTLSDSASVNIGVAPYAAGQTLTGTYLAQGGSLESTFGGYKSPVGAWTLFVADTSSGGVGELAGWSLTVVGVPDNGGTLLLSGMGVGLLGLCALRSRAPRLPHNHINI